MRLALYQPDMPPNVGTMLRMAACLEIPVDIIEPCGFPFSDRALRRAGMDYLDQTDIKRHLDWDRFLASVRPAPGSAPRLLLLTTKGGTAHHRVSYRADDILIMGRESAGAPAFVHEAADLCLRIPMRQGLRSLNVAVAAALVLGEALTQTGGWPDDPIIDRKDMPHAG